LQNARHAGIDQGANGMHVTSRRLWQIGAVVVLAAYANAAYKWLKGSGAFTSVRLRTGADSLTDLVASSMGLYCNTAAIPIFTIISAGIIPTVFTERDCDGAVFHAAGSAIQSDSVIVRHDNERTAVMGWLAVPLGLLPGWTHGSAQEHARARNGVRLAIEQHRDALAALVAR
jgi:hypothetical protein